MSNYLTSLISSYLFYILGDSEKLKGAFAHSNLCKNQALYVSNITQAFGHRPSACILGDSKIADLQAYNALFIENVFSKRFDEFSKKHILIQDFYLLFLLKVKIQFL